MEPLVKEGYLDKQGMMKFLWKKYWFYLDGNKLSYFKDESKKLPLLGSVDMSKVQTVRKTSNFNHGHEIEMHTRSKTIIVSASTSEDCTSWIESLQRAMQFERRKSSIRLASQPSFFSASEDDPGNMYDDCREVKDSDNTESLYAEAEVFYDDAQSPSPQGSKKIKPEVLPRKSIKSEKSCTSASKNQPNLYEVCPGDEEETTRDSTKTSERKLTASQIEEQVIYDVIKDDDTKEENKPEPVIETSVEQMECDEEENDGSYDALIYKVPSVKKPNSSQYCQVTLQPNVDEDDELENYDDIGELIHVDPIPELGHSEVKYSEAFKAMKKYLENNCRASELLIPPVCEGEGGKGIFMLKEYLHIKTT